MTEQPEIKKNMCSTDTTTKMPTSATTVATSVPHFLLDNVDFLTTLYKSIGIIDPGVGLHFFAGLPLPPSHHSFRPD